MATILTLDACYMPNKLSGLMEKHEDTHYRLQMS